MSFCLDCRTVQCANCDQFVLCAVHAKTDNLHDDVDREIEGLKETIRVLVEALENVETISDEWEVAPELCMHPINRIRAHAEAALARAAK